MELAEMILDSFNQHTSRNQFLELAKELVRQAPKVVRGKLEELYDHYSLFELNDVVTKDSGSFYDVYKFNKHGFVIKVIKSDDCPKTYLHKCPSKESIISTFFLYPRLKNANESIIVQDIVNTDRKKQDNAFQKICFTLNDYLMPKGILLADIWPDAHSGNVGTLKKKPVIIDFSHEFME